MDNVQLKSGLRLVTILAEHAAMIYPLMQECYPSVYAHYWKDEGAWYLQHCFREEQVRSELAVPNAAYWRVEVDQVPLGILRIINAHSSPDAPAQRGLKLHRIYLHPKIQGMGVGRQLLDFVHQHAAATDHQHVWLEAMYQQPAALRFYERMGYQTTGTMRFDAPLMYPAMRDMVRMLRRV